MQAGDKIGPYTLIREIGRGGFAVVWLAEKRSSVVTTQVAIKVPQKKQFNAVTFIEEARLWVKASGNPNVLPIIEADEYDGQIIIVSEYISDGSLKSWLRQHGGKAPSIRAAEEMIKGILSGLDFLHRQKIIHCDLKPANILLQDEIPRITDFGISEIEKHSPTISDFIKGTLEYMSPEACRGEQISLQSDIWSVGVIFYELLTGRKPFEDNDPTRLVAKICSYTPALLPDNVPFLCEKVIQIALDKSAKNRFASAKQMLEWLKGNLPRNEDEKSSNIKSEDEIDEATVVSKKENKLDFAELRYHRGLSFFTKRNYKKALKDFNEAIKLRGDSKFYQARSMVYRRLGNDDLAREDEEKGGKLKDSEEDFYSILFKLLRKYPL